MTHVEEFVITKNNCVAPSLCAQCESNPARPFEILQYPKYKREIAKTVICISKVYREFFYLDKYNALVYEHLRLNFPECLGYEDNEPIIGEEIHADRVVKMSPQIFF